VRYAAMIEVDNSREDPEAGRQGLKDELLPALMAMSGFVSTLLMTAYERGRGVAVVVFDTREDAEALFSGLAEGQAIREGVVITRTDVMEVSASAWSDRPLPVPPTRLFRLHQDAIFPTTGARIRRSGRFARTRQGRESDHGRGDDVGGTAQADNPRPIDRTRAVRGERGPDVDCRG